MARERKTIQFKLEDFQPEEGIFSGYAAVFGNVDSYGDIIEPGAFAKALEDISRIKILALHNDQWLPIGIPLDIREDGNGLPMKGKISDTTLGRDIKILLRDRVLGELSIGYDVPPTGFYYDDDGIRHLTEIDLWEISIVTWAANPQAIITDYKSMTDAAQRDLKEGRKISAQRLAVLEDTSAAMKAGAKTIDALIAEAKGEKARQPPADNLSTMQKQLQATPVAVLAYGKQRKTKKPTIEILL